MDPQLVIRVAANIDALKAALADGGSAIQATTAGMQRMVASFSGDKVVQQALNMAAAIEKTGGASRLSAAELERASAVFEKAAEKLTALGQNPAARMFTDLAEKTRNTTPHVQTLGESIRELGNRLAGDFSTQFKATLLGFVSAQAIIGAITGAWRTFTGFISGSIESFMAAETAQRRLTAALTAAGQATPGTIKQYNDLANTFQRTTVYSDDLVNEMQALLTQVGGVMPSQMDVALKAATNLASGLGIDLRQATMLVGKAFEGETGTLKRYGIVIDEAKLKAEGLPAVLEAINSKFGGQAEAEIETTAGKLKQLANEWDNVKEAVGGAIIQDPLVQAMLSAIASSSQKAADALAAQSNQLTELEKDHQRAADAVNQFNLQNDDLFTAAVLKGVPGLLALRHEVDELRGSYAEAQVEAEALSKAIAAIPSASKLINALPVVPPIPPGTIEGFQKAQKAADDASKAAEAYAKAVIALRAQLGGSALQGDLKKLEAAWNGLTPAQKANEDVIARTVAAYRNLREQGANSALLNNLSELHRINLLLNRDFQSMAPNIGAVTLPLARFRIETQGAVVGGRDLNQTLGVEMDGAMRRASVASREATERMTDFRNGTVHTSTVVRNDLVDALDMAGQMAGVFSGELGSMGPVISGVVSALGNYVQALGQAKNAADKAAAAQSLAQSGFMILFTYVMNEFAKMEAAREQGLAFADTLREINDDLRAQYGSFAQAQAMAERYGIALNEIALSYASISASSGMGSGGPRGRGADTDASRLREFQNQVEELAEAQAIVNQAIKQFGLAWTEMPDPKDRLMASGIAARELARQFQILTGAGYEVSAVMRVMQGDLNEWLADTIDAGVLIPQQMRPIIEALIRSGELTDDNARRILGMAQTSKPALEDVAAAAERYGLSLDDLGPKVQQLRIDETASQLVADWDILRAATDDVGLLFEAMGTDVQALVDDAIRYGAELPAAMRPMIQAFIDGGQLVDEFGNQITDINQLTFAADLTQMFEDLIAKLDEFISKVAGVAPAVGGIGTAAAGAAGGIKSATDALGNMAEQGIAATQSASDGMGDLTESAKKSIQTLAEAGNAAEYLGDQLREIPDEPINIVATDNATEVIESVRAAVDGLPRNVSINIDLKAAAAAGYKTREDLQKIADEAGRILKAMVDSGKFSASEIARATKAWQDALKNIDPTPMSRAEAAGYKTIQQHAEIAADLKATWEEMRDSGRYAIEDVQDAYEKWQDALGASGAGGMTKAIREELEGLKKYVATELPEFNEIGERIFGVEEQRALDRIAEIEKASKDLGNAVQSAANTAATSMETYSNKAKGAFGKLGQDGRASLEKLEEGSKEAAEKAKELWGNVNDIQTLLDDADFRTPFDDGKQSVIEMRDEVEDLIEAIGRIPTDFNPNYTGTASRMAASALSQAALSDTSWPGRMGAESSYIMPRSYALGGTPSMSDTRALEELKAIHRELAEHQPDVLFVPMKPGDTMQSLEDRLLQRLPKRILDSSMLRNAMQRAVNGGV